MNRRAPLAEGERSLRPKRQLWLWLTVRDDLGLRVYSLALWVSRDSLCGINSSMIIVSTGKRPSQLFLYLGAIHIGHIGRRSVNLMSDTVHIGSPESVVPGEASVWEHHECGGPATGDDAFVEGLDVVV